MERLPFWWSRQRLCVDVRHFVVALQLFRRCVRVVGGFGVLSSSFFWGASTAWVACLHIYSSKFAVFTLSGRFGYFRHGLELDRGVVGRGGMWGGGLFGL